MQALKTFENTYTFNDKEIRTAVNDDENSFFCAKDVCEVLDIKWSGRGNTLRSTPDKWVMVSYHETIKGERETIFISEPAVYQLAFRSKKPDAIKFTEWVCEDVLPAIRRQGFYGVVPINHQSQLRTEKRKLLCDLQTSDSFIYESTLISLRNVCNQLGEQMPNLNLLGKKRDQLDLFH